eukprot:gnl/TRDRNA2_/TRDRNA2_190349_c0_seq1.p1 gnl/TRDRNA2_/TRDRNA2_190349_c0~~gnl/TRDRNA2_/TRDRNA2_190349_c0_seq1.p1  ORF type:complete len:441 (+),score=64.10 gnl/TRDRNA2_/TRDRNA2_190349_c0_seq1:80-1402(+)
MTGSSEDSGAGGSTRRARWGRAGKAASENAQAEAAVAETSAAPSGVQEAAVASAASGAAASQAGGWRRSRAHKDSEPDSPQAVQTPTVLCESGGSGNANRSAEDAIPPLTREGPARPGLGCTIKLRSGIRMPQLGLGGGGLEGGDGRSAVAAALRTGYRLIDTALYYGTESDIAAGIRLAGLSRPDVFIATKVLQKAHVSEEQVLASLKESLKNLGTNYVDLYLIHNPRAGRIKEVWSQLLRLRDQGLARVVGVSNFGIGQLEGIREAGLEMPEVNQIEVHCWRQLPEVVEYHQRHGIATMCMAPLARGRMFGRSDLAVIAKELGYEEAAVAIRWCLQKGYIPIPKSINPQRIVSNAAEGFDLSEKTMARIQRLDSGYLSCTMASPCHEMAWSMVSDSIPHPDTWGGGRRGKGTGDAKGKGGGGGGRGYASEGCGKGGYW